MTLWMFKLSKSSAKIWNSALKPAPSLTCRCLDFRHGQKRHTLYCLCSLGRAQSCWASSYWLFATRTESWRLREKHQVVIKCSTTTERETSQWYLHAKQRGRLKHCYIHSLQRNVLFKSWPDIHYSSHIPLFSKHISLYGSWWQSAFFSFFFLCTRAWEMHKPATDPTYGPHVVWASCGL